MQYLLLVLRFAILFSLNCVSFQGASGERILFILPITSISETNIFSPLAKELARRGHEITYVAPHPVTNVPANFHQVIVTTPIEGRDFVKTTDLMTLRKLAKSKMEFIMQYNINFIFEKCEEVYQNQDFQKVLNGNYDLIIHRSVFSYCFIGLMNKFKVPTIFLETVPVPSWIVSATGLRTNLAFVPAPTLDFIDDMNFSERLLNNVFTWAVTLQELLVLRTRGQAIYRKYLGEDYPSSVELEKNVSLILSNSHFSITLPRPALPDTIEIGGLHCEPAKPLTKSLSEFVSGSTDGFIYFSLGSVVQGNAMDEQTRKTFLNVFSKLKQRVIWKWESQNMPDLPPNVKLQKWLPQQDVLGHENIRLFITHGGLLSTQEAAYYGVPLIGFPVFADQGANMNLAEHSGFALTLEILDLKEETLERAIHEILTNPKYSKKAKEVSKIFRDQPQPPLERATYWVEYVLRHKGAVHLRSAARDLNFIEYHSIDVIALILVVIAVFCYTVVAACTRVCKLCCKSDSQKLNQTRTKKNR